LRTLSKILIIILWLQASACTTTRPVLTIDERDRLGNIAIAPSQYPPQSNFIEFAEGPFSGAVKGTSIGLLTGVASTTLLYGTAALAGPAAFAAVVCTTLMTATGGAVGFVQGAMEPFTPERKQEMAEAFRVAVRNLNAQQILAEHLTTKTAEYTGASPITHKISGPTSPAAALSYKKFSGTGIDTVLEVAISDIDFDACGSGLTRPLCPDGSDDLLINFILTGKVRLVRTSNGNELYAKSFRYFSPPRSLAEWAENSAGALTNELNNGFRDLADRIASELFLVTHLEIPVPGYWTLPGDPLYLVCWLFPIDPPVQYKTIVELLADDYKFRGLLSSPFAGYPVSLMKFNQLDSCTPTLRWSAFPTDFEKERLAPDILSEIHDVTYDLRIWEAERDTRGKLVYERSGLPASSHKLEQSLEQNRFYFWSFRARFMYNGHRMSTRWASLRPTELESMKFDYCNKEDISNFSYYRFMTASEETNTSQDILAPADTTTEPGAQ
jgi:hypothetical protein